MRVYRASELGGCNKAQIAKQLGYEPSDPPDSFQTRFAEGDLHEEAVVARLVEEGYEITDRQKEVVIPISDKAQLVGHIDGIATGYILGERRVLEVKSMSQAAWDSFVKHRWDDVSFLIQKYKWQLSSYMVGLEMEALVVFKNRNTGELRYEGVELPWYGLDEIKNRIMEFELQVEEDHLPDRCNVKQYPCPFYYLCQYGEEKEKEEGLSGEEIEKIEEEVSEYQRYKSIADTANIAATALRKSIIENLEPVGSLLTNAGKVTIYDYSTRTLDKRAMQADGIDLSKYETISKSKRLRITNTKAGDEVGEQVPGMQESNSSEEDR